jgi:hypothetical protein
MPFAHGGFACRDERLKFLSFFITELDAVLFMAMPFSTHTTIQS